MAKYLYQEKFKEIVMPPSFRASSGWLQRFMTRHGLAIRRKTTELQKDPDKFIDKFVAYILQVRRQRAKFTYTDDDIVAMDETAVWQDMLSTTTVNTIGENTIRMKTTATRKVRCQFVWLRKGTALS